MISAWRARDRASTKGRITDTDSSPWTRWGRWWFTHRFSGRGDTKTWPLTKTFTHVNVVELGNLVEGIYRWVCALFAEGGLEIALEGGAAELSVRYTIMYTSAVGDAVEGRA